jgi:hypothetical protein
LLAGRILLVIHVRIYNIVPTVGKAALIAHSPFSFLCEAFEESVHRANYKDAYVVELETFYDVVTKGIAPKTTPEDYKKDLALFKMNCDALSKNY